MHIMSMNCQKKKITMIKYNITNIVLKIDSMRGYQKTNKNVKITNNNVTHLRKCPLRFPRRLVRAMDHSYKNYCVKLEYSLNIYHHNSKDDDAPSTYTIM